MGVKFPLKKTVSDKRKSRACKYNTKIVGVNANEETDGAFYVIAAWGRISTI